MSVYHTLTPKEVQLLSSFSYKKSDSLTHFEDVKRNEVLDEELSERCMICNKEKGQHRAGVPHSCPLPSFNSVWSGWSSENEFVSLLSTLKKETAETFKDIVNDL